ncbi:MAG: AI-2E family transporter [Alphaproteobacteria bacterium PRO2]|nr:AI-2E family transporter [Alphaproteobacteria bacterium PRO2]
MTAQRHFIFWGLAFASFVLLLFVFSEILLPFILGAVIAYLLNPAVDALGRRKITRGPAALLILSVFSVIVGILLALTVPVVCREIVELYNNIPAYLDRLEALFAPHRARLEAFLYPGGAPPVTDIVKEHAGAAAAAAGVIAGGVAQGGQAFLHIIGVIVVTPIVAYFMMKEWPRIIAWGRDLMPPKRRDTIMNLFREIDTKLSGFIRGQVTVALILAVSYAVALTLLGLKYGFLIGLASGLLSIIPMVGSVGGLFVGTLAAWLQEGEWQYCVAVASVFIIGQIIEGNLLTPKIVGDRVGLHPLWIFFALMAGASLLGILGMLIAVPVAAVISVLAAFAIRQYKSSPFYKGDKRG